MLIGTLIDTLIKQVNSSRNNLETGILAKCPCGSTDLPPSNSCPIIIGFV